MHQEGTYDGAFSFGTYPYLLASESDDATHTWTIDGEGAEGLQTHSWITDEGSGLETRTVGLDGFEPPGVVWDSPGMVEESDGAVSLWGAGDAVPVTYDLGAMLIAVSGGMGFGWGTQLSSPSAGWQEAGDLGGYATWGAADSLLHTSMLPAYIQAWTFDPDSMDAIAMYAEAMAQAGFGSATASNPTINPLADLYALAAAQYTPNNFVIGGFHSNSNDPYVQWVDQMLYNNGQPLAAFDAPLYGTYWDGRARSARAALALSAPFIRAGVFLVAGSWMAGPTALLGAAGSATGAMLGSTSGGLIAAILGGDAGDIAEGFGIGFFMGAASAPGPGVRGSVRTPLNFGYTGTLGMSVGGYERPQRYSVRGWQPQRTEGLHADGRVYVRTPGGSRPGDMRQTRPSGRVRSNPRTGRLDTEHIGPRGYDRALEAARRNAGDLGPAPRRMYDPETGTLIGEQSRDGLRGWRIDNDHVNWWDWSQGARSRGGRYGHEFFPPELTGPHSRFPGFAPWV